QFDKMSDKLPADKQKLLIFYCEGYTCKLSHKSAAKAIALGYKNVQVYSAGYPEWSKRIAASEKPDEKQSTAAVKAGKEEGSIDVATFEKIVSERPETIMLIDVRDSDEFKKGAMKMAVNLPVDDLEKKIQTLPTGKPIVFICTTGARSGESYYMIKDKRPEIKEVYYLDAEVTFNADGSYKITKAK
ncbi:MAG: rhodanese-like domain-containing protein, partial [Desulfobacteraceae bacterium]